MDDRVLLKVYYFGQILLQTPEGVKFVCEDPLDVVIPFTISFEELKGVICEKIDSEMSRKISCILYRYPVPVFGGFVQFQTKYVTDEASMQEMFSMYIESRAQISFIELYIEFEQSEADRNILREDYNSDSEEEFESNYEVVGEDRDVDPADDSVAPNVADVANALANEEPFEELTFMRVLDLETMHAPEFLDYMSAEVPFVADGEFAVGMEFSSREAVIKAMKEYTLQISVDYRVYESEPLTFYAKCTQYGSGCDWLIRVSMISRKNCWVIRRMRYLKCVRCQVEWSMLLTSVIRDVTVVYVHDVYKMDQVRRVYRARFRPLGNPTRWPSYNGPRFVPNPCQNRTDDRTGQSTGSLDIQQFMPSYTGSNRFSTLHGPNAGPDRYRIRFGGFPVEPVRSGTVLITLPS
ncbi:hypothetical protein Ahy_B08g091347 [Arachis hypogaea]|uniref:Transposase MuDR plant domain-containing protein n=1 Tax=Arachis hypogaea TaxID=3818 RepID=A0A444Y1Z4_ARAHY|nr:hypothetical protein Ahy_B08g091347 [Arachis hypogaea]